MLRRIGLVVGLFLIFGAGLVSASDSVQDFMNFGFSALAAYGVVLLVNKELVSLNYLKVKASERYSETRFLFVGTLFAFLGVDVLISILIPPIMNHNVVVIFGDDGIIQLGVLLALLTPLMFPQVLFIRASAKHLGMSKNAVYKTGLALYAFSAVLLVYTPSEHSLSLVSLALGLMTTPLLKVKSASVVSEGFKKQDESSDIDNTKEHSAGFSERYDDQGKD